MNEKAFWTRLRPMLKAEFGGRWERIENGVGAGTPDVNYCVRGIEGWVELKWARKVPVRSTKGVFELDGNRALDLSQINWMLMQLTAGGRVWILAGAVHHVWLVPGSLCIQFNQLTVEQLEKYDLGAKPRASAFSGLVRAKRG